MDRVWDNSKYHSKLSVSIFKVKVIQGHEAKKGQTKNLCLDGVILVFGSVFRQERENDPRTLFEPLKSDKI